MEKNIETLSINTIRMLSIDMVEKAKSGHPGLPLGAAPMAYVVWSRFLRHNPKNPAWRGRDRFILSAGHGSALLYSLLHLSGYQVPLDDLKQFRQYGSITPGHPEHSLTPGVEATTGPLGQGFAMGVGMAIAEKALSQCFNRKGIKPVNHHIYAIVSDGDLMEGVTSEAASLAATLKLGRLIYLYDDNDISIEGNTSLSFTENVKGRFEAYGWHVQEVEDGNDTAAIEKAVAAAKEKEDKPSLIIIRTKIGYGSPKEGTASVHGEALGIDNVKKTKEFFGFPPDKDFYVPEEVRAHFKDIAEKGALKEKKWNEEISRYMKEYPVEAGLLEKYLSGNINEELLKNLEFFEAGTKTATRTASGKTMNLIEKYFTEFMGGSADLAPSTKTELKGMGSFGISELCSRNIHFGVREHAMGAITNGMALHGGLIPYCATFLAFSDYMRPAIRLAAIMQCHSIFVFTHDSIGLGEDGPTHQPVEHLPSLRLIPGMTVIRPADANETVAAWYYAVTAKKPVCLVLTRQDLPVLENKGNMVFNGALKGAYTVYGDSEKPDIIIIATGSEVHISVEAAKKASGKGIKARVVSMPSVELFKAQETAYRESVIPSEIKKRLIVEAAAPVYWHWLAGDEGEILGVEKFGASAPGNVVLEKYGFSADNILDKIEKSVKK